jgi:hypothetical protein
MALQLNTFDRDAAGQNPGAEPFIRSYLGMRMAIGILGVTLPILLVVVDWWFIDTRRPIRGSMSAYYHSSARDIFVGGLIATGLFLISYMSAKRNTYDFVLSTIGGVLVIIVALLPTARSGSELGVKNFTPSGDSCEKYAGPPACNGFENRWGEDTARTIHQLSACTFVVLLALLCAVFALREFGYGPEAKALLGPAQCSVKNVLAELRRRGVHVLTYLWRGIPAGEAGATGATPRAPRRRVLTYAAAALVIVASALWALVGPDISLPFVDGKVGSTYVGEFGAFVSFGIAWLTAAWDLMPARVRNAGNLAAGAIDAVSGTAPPVPS